MIIPDRPHANRKAGDCYNSSVDIIKMVEGVDSRLAGEYDIIMTPIV